MNESSLNPHNSLLLKQHYLFDTNGEVGVGYFPYRDKIIVVLFDGSHPRSFSNIKRHSTVRVLSQDAARLDWNGRVNSPLRLTFVNRETLTEKETRIRAVLFGLAVRCRDYEEGKATANNDTTEDFPTVLNRLVGELREQNKMHKSSHHDNNTQYALEA